MQKLVNYNNEPIEMVKLHALHMTGYPAGLINKIMGGIVISIYIINEQTRVTMTMIPGMHLNVGNQKSKYIFEKI